MKIAILGAGVAGLASAISLTQLGFEVAIYERHRQPNHIGAGIVCWPNASFVLMQLGVLPRVAAMASCLAKMQRYAQDGTPLGSLNIQQLNDAMGHPSYAILRKDLMLILNQRAVELNIHVHYQYKVTNLADDDNNKTHVTFSNGESLQADIIIGADGRMNSIARHYVSGHNQPVYQGFLNWIGTFSCEHKLFSDLTISDFWGVGSRFGIVPVSAHQAYWAAGVASPKIGKREPKDYKHELLNYFGDWPQPIAQIIIGSARSAINKLYVHDHHPLETWHKNNVLLLGDAAHAALPTSGQGACQALEDAWHLGQCLQHIVQPNKQHIQQAFSTFTNLRREKTSAITFSGRQLAASLFNPDPVFCAQRNLTSQQTDYAKMASGMAQSWAKGLPLSSESIV